MNISAGYYVSDKPLKVIKNMKTQTAKNSKDEVTKVYGTWATDNDNMIVFKPGVKVELKEDDVKLPHIQALIETGNLKRVF